MLASNMFGHKASFVSSVNSRVLATIKFYSKPRSFLVFLKLFLAYALKSKKKGLYHSLLGGCTVVARAVLIMHKKSFS